MQHPSPLAITGITIAFAISLCGCAMFAAQTAQNIELPINIHTSPTNMARIFVFTQQGHAPGITVYCNKQMIGTLGQNYICWDQPPGAASLGCVCLYELRSLQLNIKSGKTYFFEVKLTRNIPKWFYEVDEIIGAAIVGKMPPPKIRYPTIPPPDPMSPTSDTPPESDPDRAAPPPDSPAKDNRIKM